MSASKVDFQGTGFWVSFFCLLPPALGTQGSRQQEDTELLVWENVTSRHLNLGPFVAPSSLQIQQPPARVCPGCRGELEAGRLPKPALRSHIHRKILLCHQPKVTLKEQFPGAPDELLTQKLTAKFPVTGGSLAQLA